VLHNVLVFMSSLPCRFHLHRALNMVGLTAATAAFILALVKFGINERHRTFGIIAMSLGFFQPFNALVRPPRAELDAKKTVLRFVWEQAHHWNGRLALVMAALAIFTGIDECAEARVITATGKWKTAFIVVIVVLGALWAALFVMHWCVWRKRAAASKHRGSDVGEEAHITHGNSTYDLGSPKALARGHRLDVE
jgi:hypothetical protein